MKLEVKAPRIRDVTHPDFFPNSLFLTETEQKQRIPAKNRMTYKDFQTNSTGSMRLLSGDLQKQRNRHKSVLQKIVDQPSDVPIKVAKFPMPSSRSEERKKRIKHFHLIQAENHVKILEERERQERRALHEYSPYIKEPQNSVRILPTLRRQTFSDKDLTAMLEENQKKMDRSERIHRKQLCSIKQTATKSLERPNLSKNENNNHLLNKILNKRKKIEERHRQSLLSFSKRKDNDIRAKINLKEEQLKLAHDEIVKHYQKRELKTKKNIEKHKSELLENREKKLEMNKIKNEFIRSRNQQQQIFIVIYQ